MKMTMTRMMIRMVSRMGRRTTIMTVSTFMISFNQACTWQLHQISISIHLTIMQLAATNKQLLLHKSMRMYGLSRFYKTIVLQGKKKTDSYGNAIIPSHCFLKDQFLNYNHHEKHYYLFSLEQKKVTYF